MSSPTDAAFKEAAVCAMASGESSWRGHRLARPEEFAAFIV
jgi:hypothetical protein